MSTISASTATNTAYKVTADTTGTLVFQTGSTPTTAVTIDGSQSLLINTTTAIPAGSGTNTGATFYAGGILGIAANGDRSLFLKRLNSDGTMAVFYRDNTGVGSISVTTTATAYNTSSDYRLKENVAPMTGALAKISALKPVTYTWKANNSEGEGFIAHELAEVFPHAVTGEKDAVDADGNPQYQGIDVSFLVGTLTAAIQELKAELDAAKADIATLKGAA